MPARSVAQRQLMAIAEHHPSEVSAKNREVLKMSHTQLHEFADTKGLKNKYVNKSGIHINPAHKGMLHEVLDIAKGKRIPGSKLKSALKGAKKSGDNKEEKEIVFAQNSKKWKH